MIENIPDVQIVEIVRKDEELDELVVFPSNKKDILGSIRNSMDEDGLKVLEMYVERGRLEEVFRELTVGGLEVKNA